MKQAPNSQFLPALTAERAALLDFVALLEREQGMLVENITDQLFELSEQKTSSAQNLNQLAKTRLALMPKDIPQLGAEAIRNWLKMHSPQGLSVWQELISLAERAKRLNQANGELIQMKMRRNQKMLTALSNAVNKASLYGPDGQTSFPPGSGRSLGSG